MSDQTTSAVKHLTEADFDDTIKNATVPVLVDFFAEWCGPCKMAAPVIEEIAMEYADKAILAKVDVDQENALAGRFGVMSIPTMIVFKGGEEVDRQTGFAGKQGILALLGKHLD